MKRPFRFDLNGKFFLPVDAIHGVSGAQKTAEASITLVDQGIASRGTADHAVQVEDSSLVSEFRGIVLEVILWGICRWTRIIPISKMNKI